MNDFQNEIREFDPDYFSLSVRRAFRDELGPEGYLDDCLAGVVGPTAEQLETSLSAALLDHPEVVEAGFEVAAAESLVLAAEDAGVTDELAMRRLERARAAERGVLVRLQNQRAIGHTRRAESRTAQVVPMRPALRLVAGGEAA